MNTFLLAGDIFIPEMHLKQPGITYCDCGAITKIKERIEKFMETANTGFICRNELDKTCFRHDIAYGKSQNLVKRTQSDKVLKDETFKFAFKIRWLSKGISFNGLQVFDKKSSGSGIANQPNAGKWAS